ncbi:hypothetical protein [Streptomyces altiplanensis]
MALPVPEHELDETELNGDELDVAYKLSETVPLPEPLGSDLDTSEF